MAIFVEHKKTGGLFVLISGGFGIYQSAANSNISGLMKMYEEGIRLKVCVCDQRGNLGWFNSDEIRVINVDGIDIKELDDLASFTWS